MIAQRSELAILGTKIVAPFADAMRFVDGDEIDRKGTQALDEAWVQQALGSDVEQTVLAIMQAAEPGARLDFTQ